MQKNDLSRTEAFSDGVFAIAITLLILEVKVPRLTPDATAGQLWHALGQQWPSYIALLTSFFSILIMWLNHHRMFDQLARSSGAFMIVNGILLLLVTFVPYPTAILAGYLLSPAGGAAAAFYAGTFVVIATMYTMLWYVARRDGLLVQSVSPAQARRYILRTLLGLSLYLTATIVAFFNTYASVGICSALWLYWLMQPYKGK